MEEKPGTVIRLLTLLEILQARGRVPGPVLADRLGIDGRTLRRDVERLGRLGIPVEAQRGRHGGYQLRPGFRLPPLMLTEDEAVAVALGLRAGRQLGVGPPGPAVEGALDKITRVLPLRLRDQVTALEEAVGFLGEPVSGEAPPTAAMLTMGAAAARQRRAWMRYRDTRGRESERAVEPYGLVVHRGRWYLSARDVALGAVRLFRLDRVVDARELRESFHRPRDFDPAAHVQGSLLAVPWGWDVEVLLELPLAEARRRVPATVAALEETPEGTRLRTGAARLDRIARYLVGLQCRFRVVRPPELGEALQRLGEELLTYAGDSDAR